MTQKMFKEILDRYLRGACSDAERKFIDSWFENFHADVPVELSEDQAIEARMLIALQKRMHKTSTVSKSMQTLRPWRLAAAAIVTFALLTFTYTWLNRAAVFELANISSQNNNTYLKEVTNSSSTPLKVVLPDGSEITLQNGSSIQYDSSFNNPTREVYLEGEAFFNVHRDVKRPFMVYAHDLVTKVLGTSFTITAFEDDEHVTVKVKTGKVIVYTTEKKKSNKLQPVENTLTPNQQIVFNRSEKKTARSLIEHPEVVVPLEEVRNMRFEEAPVTEIWRALEKIYGMKIEFDEVAFAKCTLTTSVSDGGIYNRMDIICKAIGATYTLEENQIRVTGSGCN